MIITIAMSMSNIEFSSSSTSGDFVNVRDTLPYATSYSGEGGSTYSCRISAHLPQQYHRRLYTALGPNWEYHLMQEMKARSKAEIEALQLDPEDKLSRFSWIDQETDINAKWCSDEAVLVLDDILNGVGIVNKGTLNALYSWSPQVLIRHQLERFPEWKVFPGQTVSLVPVTRLAKTIDGYGPSMTIQEISYEDRVKLWQNEIQEVFGERGTVCLDCKMKSPPTRGEGPQLKAMPCRRFYHREPAPFCCSRCGKLGAHDIAY